MDTLSSMFRPALSRITSSIASTASSGLSRALDFTGSFNDRTSLLAAGAAPSPAQDSAAPPPPTTTVSNIAGLDIEAAAPDGTTDVGSDQHADELRRVSKSVHTVCLFAASASLVLLVNLPSRRSGSALYCANLALIWLGMLTSLGLSMFSVVAKPGEPAVVRVQKRAMVMAMACVLLSFALRVFMVLPAVSLGWASLFFFLFAGAAALYLFLAWKMGGNGRPSIPPNATPDEEAP